jgi:secondary thiamine-phosphate synthase enzyme
MRQALHRLHVDTRGEGLVEITAPIKAWLSETGIKDGVLMVYCRHTSASLLIQENADPDVCKDLQTFFARIAPEGRGLYVHEAEGPDDMPAHIRAALTQTQLSIPIEGGQLLLGTWQGIYLFEHRRAPHRREIVLHVIAE